jgi:hypothetical protein
MLSDERSAAIATNRYSCSVLGARSRLLVCLPFELVLLDDVPDHRRIVASPATGEGKPPLLVLERITHRAVWREAKTPARQDATEGRLSGRVVEEVFAWIEVDGRHRSDPKS